MSSKLPYIELHSIIMLWSYMNQPYIELHFVTVSTSFTSVPFGSGILFTCCHAVFGGSTQQNNGISLCAHASGMHMKLPCIELHSVIWDLFTHYHAFVVVQHDNIMEQFVCMHLILFFGGLMQQHYGTIYVCAP